MPPNLPPLTGADMAQSEEHDMAGWRKTAEEFGPLLVFFILNARRAMVWPAESQSLFIATGGFMCWQSPLA